MTIKRIWFVYLGGFLLTTHYATIAYLNSSLLKQFTSDQNVNLLFVLGSVLSILSLILAPFLIRKFGNKIMLAFFVLLEIFAMFGMGSVNVALFIFILFLIHQSAESIIYFLLDIGLESETKKEGTTGNNRGIFLSIQNIAWVLSPLAMSFLINGDDFGNVYYLSGLILIPLILIGLIFFKKTKAVESDSSSMISVIKVLRKNLDKARIIGVQLVLHSYFAWMLIYLPLLLNLEIGFSWSKIGIIFTIMLLPYLLFELPAGILGDKKVGEKEILIFGFLIIFLSTLAIPLIKSPVFWIWASVLFATRVGASLVEISSESYFFKHVKEHDTALISLFRMARPMSFVLVPLITLPLSLVFSYSSLFYFLAFLTLLGLFFIPKVDTR